MSTLALTPDVLAWLARQPRARRSKFYTAYGRQEWQRCADDVLYWLDSSKHSVPYCHTRDPKQLYTCRLCQDGASYFFDKRHTHLEMRHGIDDPEESILRMHFEPLPTVRPFTMFEYIEPIVRAWLRKKIVLIEKSRDMMATWMIVALYTWDTLFHENRENIFQSDDSSKTLDLVERAYFIYQNQPKFLRDICRTQFTSGTSRAGILRVPSLNSVILGFPQGADQVRQFHPSGVFQDEAAFQIQAGDAFMAVKPAIMAGGRFTAVSSANPGWFYAACRDALEMAV